jgi:hypothetical protein
MSQAPISGERFLVRYLSEPGHVVLDLFAGTATASVAALKEGRNVIAVESDKFQFNIGNARARTFFDSERLKAVTMGVYDVGEVAPANEAELIESYKTGVGGMTQNPTFDEVLQIVELGGKKSITLAALQTVSLSREESFDVEDMVDEFCGAMCQSLTRYTLLNLLPPEETAENKRKRAAAVSEAYDGMGVTDMVKHFAAWLGRDEANVSQV